MDSHSPWIGELEKEYKADLSRKSTITYSNLRQKINSKEIAYHIMEEFIFQNTASYIWGINVIPETSDSPIERATYVSVLPKKCFSLGEEWICHLHFLPLKGSKEIKEELTFWSSYPDSVKCCPDFFNNHTSSSSTLKTLGRSL